jgi:hypothetical protein
VTVAARDPNTAVQKLATVGLGDGPEHERVGLCSKLTC